MKDEKGSDISPNTGSNLHMKIGVVILKVNLKDNLKVVIRRSRVISKTRNAGVMAHAIIKSVGPSRLVQLILLFYTSALLYLTELNSGTFQSYVYSIRQS